MKINITFKTPDALDAIHSAFLEASDQEFEGADQWIHGFFDWKEHDSITLEFDTGARTVKVLDKKARNACVGAIASLSQTRFIRACRAIKTFTVGGAR